ncbi:hypothetical protein TNCV_1595371 [Trichonephila clavipes]|nr:hypothetical protein TNCV_1595371 [Trichonephila clavipes]
MDYNHRLLRKSDTLHVLKTPSTVRIGLMFLSGLPLGGSSSLDEYRDFANTNMASEDHRVKGLMHFKFVQVEYLTSLEPVLVPLTAFKLTRSSPIEMFQRTTSPGATIDPLNREVNATNQL